jgi:hypothetical protein
MAGCDRMGNWIELNRGPARRLWDFEHVRGRGGGQLQWASVAATGFRLCRYSLGQRKFQATSTTAGSRANACHHRVRTRLFAGANGIRTSSPPHTGKPLHRAGAWKRGFGGLFQITPLTDLRSWGRSNAVVGVKLVRNRSLLANTAERTLACQPTRRPCADLSLMRAAALPRA